ncbi:MAG: hypothetical protein J5565_02360 [Muribaculaceae bacterium]|nr:hypothetical protein [Muribaculaceae bacterium]
MAGETMTFKEEIRQLLDDENRPVTREWLQQVMEQYPYFNVPLLLYLKRNPDAPDREDVLARLAISSPDRRALATQLGENMESFAHFYPEETVPDTPDTDTTIDRFLNNYGSTSPKEIAALEQAIFNPTPDYADVLAAQESEQGQPDMSATSEQDELINQFIAQHQVQELQADQDPSRRHVDEEEKQEIANDQVQKPELVDSSMLTESLAKMYISRKKYSQALEIIETLSLQFPEKSIYFADQIRFLRKLVLIQKKNNI